MKILNTAEGPQICVESRSDGTTELRIDLKAWLLEQKPADEVPFLLTLTLSAEERGLLQLELLSPKQRALVSHTVREQVKQLAGPAVGRNSPCPCGSGKKFKNCHAQ